MADYAETGLPPAYLPKNERNTNHDTVDNGKNDDSDTKEEPHG